MWNVHLRDKLGALVGVLPGLVLRHHRFQLISCMPKLVEILAMLVMEFKQSTLKYFVGRLEVELKQVVILRCSLS